MLQDGVGSIAYWSNNKRGLEKVSIEFSRSHDARRHAWRRKQDKHVYISKFGQYVSTYGSENISALYIMSIQDAAVCH